MSPFASQTPTPPPKKQMLLWQEDIPPFCSLRDAQWWDDRAIAVADFAGGDVTFNFTAEYLDGRECPYLVIGFDRVALVRLGPSL